MMAASRPPDWQLPSRRHNRRVHQTSAEPAPDSRSERNRERRERSMERQFAWLFAFAVAGTTLYLISRTPWALTFIRGHF
ncbi:MAG: hypothetical protein M0Z36_01990 [Thermaerobacter sp.]|nr:hypothetical protein [Thermaerobacter sp.]